jgi:phenylalanyl-tRNA synthetase alpha chain
MDELTRIVDTALSEFLGCGDAAALENAKARYLGKTGVLTEQLKGLGKLSATERPAAGARINEAKVTLEAALNARRGALADASWNRSSLAKRSTSPARCAPALARCIRLRTLERVEALFRPLGFTVADGPRRGRFPQLTALNTPENHPPDRCRTLTSKAAVLRTHTAHPDPIHGNARTADQDHAPGRVYRVDSDATHSPMFHQVEGLWIDHDVSFADLKGVFTEFLRNFFERDDIKVRFRPSFFPFTEPSAEIDMAFGDGGWLELAGSGQVHPNVLSAVGLDPQRWQGFAFGMGPDRLAMLRYGVNDLRLFYENDLRFLRQFA